MKLLVLRTVFLGRHVVGAMRGRDRERTEGNARFARVHEAFHVCERPSPALR